MEVIGREERIVRRDLDDDEVAERVRTIRKLHTQKREAEAAFTAFRKFAAPRIRKTFDPDYDAKDLDAVDDLELAEAHGLRHQLVLKRKLKTAQVAALRAEMEHLEATAALGAEFLRVDVELLADVDKLEVIYVNPATGEEVDRRAMTPDERQEALPGTEGATRAPAPPALQ